MSDPEASGPESKSHLQFPAMFNTIVRAVAVGAGAASRYGSGSDQMMRFLAAPVPAPASQRWL
jgi:hypothetical protein